MGWFSSKDSVASLRKRGEGVALLHFVCDEEKSPEERTKALQALAELPANCGTTMVHKTLQALLERILDFDYYRLRGPFIATFVQLFNKQKGGSYTPAKAIRESYIFGSFLAALSNRKMVEATLQRLRKHYKNPEYGGPKYFESYREDDNDRLALLPIAELLCVGDGREHLLFMANDPNPIFRACFLEWFATPGDKTHLSVILNLSLDPFAEVRQSAFRALVTIGQPMVQDLIPFLEENAPAGPDIVDFCAKIFSQPKAALLGALINQRCSRLGPKPDSKDVDALRALFDQLAKVREAPASQIALQLFNQTEQTKAPVLILKAACKALDPADGSCRARLEAITQDFHVCREEARELLFNHQMGATKGSQNGWDFHDLRAQGQVSIEAQGESITVLIVSISNLSDADLKVRIPKGTLFLASGNWQDMVTTDSVTVMISATGSSRLRIPVACARAGLPIPNESNGFREVVRAKGDLAKLMNSLCEGHGLSTLAVQAAVWSVTDGYSASQIQDRLLDAKTGAKVITPTHLNKARQILEGAGFSNRL